MSGRKAAVGPDRGRGHGGRRVMDGRDHAAFGARREMVGGEGIEPPTLSV